MMWVVKKSLVDTKNFVLSNKMDEVTINWDGKFFGPSWLGDVKNQEFSLGHGLFELSVIHLNGDVEQEIRLSLEFMVEIKAGDLILGVFCIEMVF